MRTCIFAYTPASTGPGYVPYVSLNEEEDGHYTLAVRSRGAQNASTIDLSDSELDSLAVKLLARRNVRDLLKRVELLEKRLDDGMPRIDYARGGVRLNSAAGFLVGESGLQTIHQDGSTRVIDLVTGSDLGSAD